MYRDNSLVPSEALRLLALGLLAEGPRSYALLASQVRRFIEGVVGPSLDLLAAPLELLQVEGFAEERSPGGSDGEEVLGLTDAGREEFERLMASNLRAPVSDVNKLILAVKLRFLPLAPIPVQRLQLETMAEIYARQAHRLAALAGELDGGQGDLGPWLERDRSEAEARRQWLSEKLERLPREAS